MQRLSILVFLLPLLCPTSAVSQEAGSAYADAEARRLVQGALFQPGVAQQEGTVHGIVRSRVRTGILIPKQWNWRDRTLFRKETLGVVEYSVDGGADESVLARSRGAPVIGDRLIHHPALAGRIGFDPEESDPALLGLLGLSLGSIAPDLPTGSSPGVYEVFDSAFVDPLGPLGPVTYRYNLGRDLVLDDGPEPRTLRAVEFRPGSAEGDVPTGIVWFDGASGAPVRTMIRPRESWALRGGLRGFLSKIPLLQKDAQGDLEFLTVDYVRRDDGLFWPSVAHVHGSMLLLWGQAILPVKVEWDLDWDAERPTEAEADLPEPLSSGWSFSLEHRTLHPYIREMDRVVGPPPAPSLGETVARTLGTARFNQVQGVNFRVPYSVPLGARSSLLIELGVPTSGFQPTGTLGIEWDAYPYRWGVEGYSRLKDANWMEHVNGTSSSITAILTGYDDGQYYLASGGELWMRYGDEPFGGTVSLFAEDHRTAPKVATYSLFEPDSTQALPTELPIDAGAYYGVRASLDLQAGDDPQRGVLLTRVYGQAAVGERSFASIGTTTDLVGPLPGPFTAGFRIDAGMANRDAPGQALYYLGGYKTIRGYPANIASGPSTAILTGELGTDTPLARLVVFGEVGWANEPRRLFSDDALTTVGGGISLGDGILRIDIAKGLSEGGVWRFHFATSGLF